MKRSFAITLVCLILGLASSLGATPTTTPASTPAAATATGGAAAHHPDDTLYDLRPIEAAYPELAPLMAAWRGRNHRRVLSLASRLAANSDRQLVRTAAGYLLARTHDRRRRGAAAEKAWRRIAQSGPLADRARWRLAELAFERQDVHAAIANLSAISSWHVDRRRARLRIAELELDRGRVGPAAAVLEGLEPAALTRKDAARWRLFSGDVARRRGDEQGAAARYLEVWRTGAAKRSTALERLAAMGLPPGPIDRVERLVKDAPRRWRRGRRGRKQRRAWHNGLDRLAAGMPGLAEYGRGLLQRRHRSLREKTVKTLSKALPLAQDPTLQERIRYALGDAQGRAGQDAEAITTLEPLVAVDRQDALSAKTLWRLHRLYRATGRTLDVDRVLQRLLAHPQASHLRQEVTWTAAWRRFRVGDCPEALRLFGQLASDPSATFNHGRQSWRARSRYWQARCHARKGRHEQAMALWRSVVDEHPLTWYGALALDRIRESDPQLAARILGQPPAAATSESAAPSVEQLRVRRHHTLDEAALLVALGQTRTASRLLRRQLRAGLSSGGVHLLATLYELAGRTRMAFATLQRFTRVAPRPDPSTVAVWRLAFPTPWRDLFEKAAAAASIPRAWLYAIARHESAFVRTARSNAGAVGLVQVLPTVARRIAELYGLKVRRSWALKRPSYNLAVGARYLGELQSFYGGNRPLASAGYNAGPYAVQKWLKRTGRMAADAFVESIPYPGARRYAMRVAATAQSYAWLYPEWGEVNAVATGRKAMTPARLGPFMQGPNGQTSRVWPAPIIARPRRLAGASWSSTPAVFVTP